jgi:hypothetical protein
LQAVRTRGGFDSPDGRVDSRVAAEEWLMQPTVPAGTQLAREPQAREAHAQRNALAAPPARGARPARPSREPFPWFVLVLFALLAVGVVTTSAVRMFRFHIEDTAREQRWRLQHDAMLREVAEHEDVP